jgi:ribosomal protein S21
MVEVKVFNGRVHEAISVFTEKVKRSGVLDLYKEKQSYKKPSEVKREKRKKAIFNSKNR